ncbi:MAG TPA: riboflavin synthase [Syntrophaceticus sp.]|nr:riboflavin synthase [Syntrophaceticus sp.]
MFTGLVEEKGIMRGIRKGPVSAALTIESGFCGELEIGESVAVNGVCLTVTAYNSRTFTADVMAETLDKTNLGLLTEGERVNLERALKVGARIGGHFVTGHVDAVGKIINIAQRGIATEIWIEIPSDLEPYLIPQGSIALDGASLTVAELQGSTMKVSLIPHTLEATTLGLKKAGDLLNIEADLLGKYVCFLLEKKEAGKGFSVEFLAEHGFI